MGPLLHGILRYADDRALRQHPLFKVFVDCSHIILIYMCTMCTRTRAQWQLYDSLLWTVLAAVTRQEVGP